MAINIFSWAHVLFKGLLIYLFIFFSTSFFPQILAAHLIEAIVDIFIVALFHCLAYVFGKGVDFRLLLYLADFFFKLILPFL